MNHGDAWIGKWSGAEMTIGNGSGSVNEEEGVVGPPEEGQTRKSRSRKWRKWDEQEQRDGSGSWKRIRT